MSKHWLAASNRSGLRRHTIATSVVGRPAPSSASCGQPVKRGWSAGCVARLRRSDWRAHNRVDRGRKGRGKARDPWPRNRKGTTGTGTSCDVCKCAPFGVMSQACLRRCSIRRGARGSHHMVHPRASDACCTAAHSCGCHPHGPFQFMVRHQSKIEIDRLIPSNSCPPFIINRRVVAAIEGGSSSQSSLPGHVAASCAEAD